LDSFLTVAKFAKKRANYSPHATPEIKNNRNAETGTNIANRVRMMGELFIFKLCTALICNFVKNFSQNHAE